MFIRVVEKMPVEKNSEIKKIEMQEFERDHALEWLCSDDKTIASLERQQLNESVALYQAPENMGYGVVCVNPNGIPAGTIIGEYTGEAKEYEHDAYRFNDQHGRVVSSRYKGNVVRFFLSLPSAGEIENETALTAEQKQVTAVANCRIETRSVHDKWRTLLITNHKIEFGKVMGWNYGLQYWCTSRYVSNGAIKMEYFNDTTGAVINAPLSHYDFCFSTQDIEFQHATNQGKVIKLKDNLHATEKCENDMTLFAPISADLLAEYLENWQAISLQGATTGAKYIVDIDDVKNVLRAFYQPREHTEKIRRLLYPAPAMRFFPEASSPDHVPPIRVISNFKKL